MGDSSCPGIRMKEQDGRWRGGGIGSGYKHTHTHAPPLPHFLGGGGGGRDAFETEFLLIRLRDVYRCN